MSDENGSKPARTRKLGEIRVAEVTPSGMLDILNGVYETTVDAKRWLKADADEGEYQIVRLVGDPMRVQVQRVETRTLVTLDTDASDVEPGSEGDAAEIPTGDGDIGSPGRGL